MTELRKLTADPGKVLTNGETWGETVYLGIYDTPENWQQVDKPAPAVYNEEN